MSSRALKHFTHVCAAVAALGVALVANAAIADEPPPAAAPSGPAPDEQPPPQALPSCAPEQTSETTPAPTPAPSPPMAEPAPSVYHGRRHNRIFAPQEVGVTTGAGVANYFGNGGLTGFTDAGAAWDARLVFGTQSVIALEAGYVGATNKIDDGLGGHGHVDSQGVDGDLRLQLPTRVQPYVFGGVGYNHMSIGNNTGSTAGPLSQTDDQVTVPAGGGLTGYISKHATVDVRGTYRYIPDNGLTIMNSNHLHQWVAQAHLGYAF